ncbi:MAG: LysE family translocator [Flavobacteriaceae bacterium]
MWENLASFSFISFLLALSPGPDNIYVLTQSLSYGVKSGIATTMGLVSGCVVHTTLLAFGVSAIIAASETALFVIKIIGAVYLFYLSLRVFRSNASIELSGKVPGKNQWELFKIGLVMNLVNPKVLLFFLAFFPIFLWDPTSGTIGQFYLLGGTFMIIAFLVFSLIAVLAGRISSFLLKYKKMGLFLKWLQISVFLGIALFIVLG